MSKYDSCCHPGKRERFLEPSILYLLSQQADHGYSLLNRLRRYGFSETVPDPGSLYRILRKFESRQLIVSAWESGESGPAKRIYTLTDEGFHTLKQWISMLEQNVVFIQRLLDDYRTSREQET